ncbi:NADPH-dependent FMN reductase [Pseudonocardia sp. CA-107938]|uniref:NADPH-dependent FMN reductase n=1 Tax=Pseudonocardia sp. CA-107938 TaxID=3240021 RepID=UPI003D950102
MNELRIAVLVGSTRAARRGPAVASWVAEAARRHPDLAGARVDIVDVADAELPLLDEPVPAIAGDYRNPHTVRWAETVRSYDAFVVVTPVHNASYPASLKNAIDYLYAEWNGAVVGLVGYGAHGGTRAIDHLRTVFAEVKAITLAQEVSLEIFGDFDFSDADPTDRTAIGRVAPRPQQVEALHALLGAVAAWARPRAAVAA